MTISSASGTPAAKIENARSVGRIIAAPASGRGSRARSDRRSGPRSRRSATGSARWRSTGNASTLTSSGMTKSRPCSAAKARAADASMLAARVEAPTSSEECSRVAADHVDDVVDQRVGQADVRHRVAHLRASTARVGDRLEAEILEPRHGGAVAVPAHDLALLVAARDGRSMILNRKRSSCASGSG